MMEILVEESGDLEAVLELLDYESQIHDDRGYHNHPLTEQQSESNREKVKGYD